jgi:DNA polymerase-3 subunit delta'
MEFKEYLKIKQKFVYNTFKNALSLNRLSQAYLIKGGEGAPVMETALFLAKSLVCENGASLADDTCLNCIRFDEGNYSDFMLIDGKKQTIKVGDIEALEEFLSSSSMEKAGKKIYLINCLENSNKEAVNALLKTLEEPAQNVYAFITTENEAKLLPTIISRCQVLNLLPGSKEIVKEDVTSKGVSLEDAEILSSLYSNEETILNNINDDTYKTCKDCLIKTMEELEVSPSKALFSIQTQIEKYINTKETLRMYLDLLSVLFKDIVNYSTNNPIVLKEKEETIHTISKNIKNPEKIYLEIVLTRGKIESNVSIALILEHLFIYIAKEGGR